MDGIHVAGGELKFAALRTAEGMPDMLTPRVLIKRFVYAEEIRAGRALVMVRVPRRYSPIFSSFAHGETEALRRFGNWLMKSQTGPSGPQQP